MDDLRLKFARKIRLTDERIEVDGEEFPWYVAPEVEVTPPQYDERGVMVDVGRLHIVLYADAIEDLRESKVNA